MVSEKTFTDSSIIAHIKYFDDTQTMEIKYLTGVIYYYFNVPREVFDKALEAKSIGSFVSWNIKGVYQYEKAV